MVMKLRGEGGRLLLRSNDSLLLDPSGMPDLVAWYKADSLALSNGNTVTSWSDDSPNNNDLNSYESAPIYNSSDALLNGMPSVTYDGNDSNYRSNPTGLPVGSSACTTYVVGYWSGASSTADMFTWGSNAYTGARMGAGYYGGMVFENGGIASAQRAVSANTPFIFSYPYVAGANTTAATTYLNGIVAVGEYPGGAGVPNISNPVAEIVIGRPATAPAERWTGAVAEVLVFNTTHDSNTRRGVETYLSNKYGIPIAEAVTSGKLLIRPAPLPSIILDGLVMYLDAGNPASYPGSGTTWTDLSGQGNNATLASHTFDSGNGGSIVFNGSQNAPTSTNGFPFGSSAGSIAGWAKISIMTGGTSWIFSYGSPFQSASRFVGRLGSTFWAGGYNDDITFGTAQTNTWFNMVATWDGSNARMYIDGSLVSGPTSRGWNTVSSAAYVGAQTSGGEGWYGNIAQVLVYNRALTDAEVLQNFNIDKARFGL
jgi:hypothetical protein